MPPTDQGVHPGPIRPDWLRSALLALAFATAGKLVGAWLAGFPVLSLIAYTSVVFVVSAVLFGWVGLGAATAVQVGSILWRDMEISWPSLGAYVAAGAIAWFVMSRVPRLGRGFDSLRTLGWYAAAAAFGAVVSSSVITGTSASVDDFWGTVAVWSRSTTVTLWVFGPPLLILGHRWLRRWLAPIRGEAPRSEPRVVVLHWDTETPGTATRIADVETRPADELRTLGICLVALGMITVAKLLFVGDWSPSAGWWSILYLGPVYLMAERFHLPGGLLGAAFVGLLSLAGDAYLAPEAGIEETTALAVYAELLLFWAVGTLLGRAAQREDRLVASLAESHQRLRQDLQRVVRALTGALQAKDEYTEGHQSRVREFAVEVGRRLGVTGLELEHLQIASTLHDIGKIAIPDSILNKPAALTPEELATMRRHPEIGARLIGGIDGLEEAAPLVLHHHERWDGKTDGRYPGYPAGIAGNEIPLGARIISVVDTFDAMTTNRPYRQGRPVGEARAELERERGAQFDPAVVDRFLELVAERPWD